MVFLLILESAHAEITVKNCGEVPKIISTFLTKRPKKKLEIIKEIKSIDLLKKPEFREIYVLTLHTFTEEIFSFTRKLFLYPS